MLTELYSWMGDAEDGVSKKSNPSPSMAKCNNGSTPFISTNAAAMPLKPTGSGRRRPADVQRHHSYASLFDGTNSLGLFFVDSSPKSPVDVSFYTPQCHPWYQLPQAQAGSTPRDSKSRARPHSGSLPRSLADDATRTREAHRGDPAEELAALLGLDPQALTSSFSNADGGAEEEDELVPSLPSHFHITDTTLQSSSRARTQGSVAEVEAMLGLDSQLPSHPTVNNAEKNEEWFLTYLNAFPTVSPSSESLPTHFHITDTTQIGMDSPSPCTDLDPDVSLKWFMYRLSQVQSRIEALAGKEEERIIIQDYCLAAPPESTRPRRSMRHYKAPRPKMPEIITRDMVLKWEMECEDQACGV